MKETITKLLPCSKITFLFWIRVRKLKVLLMLLMGGWARWILGVIVLASDEFSYPDKKTRLYTRAHGWHRGKVLVHHGK